jgi:hypothetical protein
MICFSMLINHTSLIVEILEDPKYHFFPQNKTKHKDTRAVLMVMNLELLKGETRLL